MARHRRRTYEEAISEDGVGGGEGIPCRTCGCRHHHVEHTDKVGDVIRRRCRCRYCGSVFYTTETA